MFAMFLSFTLIPMGSSNRLTIQSNYDAPNVFMFLLISEYCFTRSGLVYIQLKEAVSITILLVTLF